MQDPTLLCLEWSSFAYPSRAFDEISVEGFRLITGIAGDSVWGAVGGPGYVLVVTKVCKRF